MVINYALDPSSESKRGNFPMETDQFFDFLNK